MRVIDLVPCTGIAEEAITEVAYESGGMEGRQSTALRWLCPRLRAGRPMPTMLPGAGMHSHVTRNVGGRRCPRRTRGKDEAARLPICRYRVG